jgi:uncharacterized glyoxalase superfamily protein PhnB
MSVHQLFPYLRLRDAGRAIEFYARVFGAIEKFRLAEPSGRVGHAELDFGGSTLMLSEEYPERGLVGPATIGGTSVTLHLHVDDADEVLARAVAAGAIIVRAAEDHFYGERSGTLRDPFGHEWNVGHHIEEVSPEEMKRRLDAMMKGGA